LGRHPSPHQIKTIHYPYLQIQKYPTLSETKARLNERENAEIYLPKFSSIFNKRKIKIGYIRDILMILIFSMKIISQ